MQLNWFQPVLMVALILCVLGCRSQRKQFTAAEPTHLIEVQQTAFQDEAKASNSPTANPQKKSEETIEEDANKTPEPIPLPVPLAEVGENSEVSEDSNPLHLETVISSVHSHFPLIRQAIANRRIASGEALSASGAFDHKLNAFSESQPLGFYENYRQEIGLKRATMWGGQTFAGYRVGRGLFEPWYLERETNAGGEFKAGFMAPLVSDRWIDANRAALWQARLEQRRVEPEIMAVVIMSVRDGTIAYWNWVIAGANYQIADDQLQIALKRNKGLQAQVKAQEKAPLDLTDNRRIIVSREAKVIDARRKLEQAAVKLSLFYRSAEGTPTLPQDSQLPQELMDNLLREILTNGVPLEADDANFALGQRPELEELRIVRRQLSVALRQARNETLPDVDGGFNVSQDMGEPTSDKRDKSELEIEALITISVPLERRKALGKVRSLRGKLAKLNAKNQFTSNKIVAEVRMARAALTAAHGKVRRADESYHLALQVQRAEQGFFDFGESSLFNLNIREKQTAEAAAERAQALLEFLVAHADYLAAMGLEMPPSPLLTEDPVILP